MCKAGNGTIYAECRDKVLQGMRRTHASNAEMRQFIRSVGNDGCLMTKAKREAKVAQIQEPVLVS